MQRETPPAVRKQSARSLVLGVPEFSDALNLSTRSAYKLIDRGEVRAIRIGGSVKIPRSELERILSGDARMAAE